MELVKLVLIPLAISLLLVPVVKLIGVRLNAYAQMNERTIHKKPTVRIGGVAIFVSFLIGMALFVKVDTTLNAILIGGAIIFLGGLIDDLIDIKPLVKLMFEVVSALVLVLNGVTLSDIHLPFLPVIPMGPITMLVSVIWILGITNAINLIDGLDGLCGGLSSVLLTVIACLALVDGRMDVVVLSLILLGAILGVLVFNSYPASIFLGDSGALFIGFNIAALSLLGFKSSTAITLALPLLMLMVPIMDTLSAILRRKLKKQSVSQADRGHMHHILMERFGHRNTVLIMCGITMLCGLVAYIYIINKVVGFFSLLVLIFALELFIEYTGMISPKFHPIIGGLRRLKKLLLQVGHKSENK